MLFLTEIKNQRRPASSYYHHSRPGSRENSRKFTKQTTLSKTNTPKHKSSHAVSRHENTKIELEKSIEAMKGRSTAQQKWHRIVELFHLFKEIESSECPNSINPSPLSTPQNQANSLTKLSFTRSTERYKSKYQKINSNYVIAMLSGQSDQDEPKITKKNHFHLEEEQKQDKLKQQQKKMIRTNIFQTMLKANLTENKYKFNIPETIIMDQDRAFQLLSTQKGIVSKRSIKKAQTCAIFDKGHQNAFKKIKESNIKGIYQQMYQHLIDHKINPMAPYVAISFQNNKKDLSIQIQNIRNFGENRWNSNSSCYVQRYIYSRNLKAMVMRTVYERKERGQQKQEYYINRFQNYSNIFRVNNNGFHDFLDLKVKVAPSYIRQYTLQYSKLTGPGILSKFIEPTTQVRRLIENVHKKRVLRLWVDFIQDLSGIVWVIGVKAVVFQQIQSVQCKELWLMASHVGLCRLCNGVFQKNHLQNSVSVRMLLQFLHHLRRRTRIQNFQNVEFSNSLALNRKQNAMSAVCQCCYQLIIRQLQLKKYERQLGRLCHIRVQDEGDPPKIEGKELHQWRLMVYLEEIIQQTKENVGELRSSKAENVIIRYVLAKGIQQKWKCKVQQKKIPIKKVKVHYFFSQLSNIQEFLKNTQILVSVLSSNKEQKQEVIAQGSTGILANFRNKFVTQNGQRQTTTVLLFFESGKYCALTLKVGLVYDGMYKSPEISLKTINSVLFPTRDCLNSNPLPKEWMEAFGYDQQICLKQMKYEDLFKDKPNAAKKKELKKKCMKKLF